MNVIERIKKIGERWFLTEPLLFAVYCSHEFVENNSIDVSMRIGNMKVEFAPKILLQCGIRAHTFPSTASWSR